MIGTGQLQCAQDPNAAKQTVRHVFKSPDHLAMTTRRSHLRRCGASATLTAPPWVEDGDPDAAVVEQAGFSTCCCHKGQSERKHHNTCFNADRRCWGNFRGWCGCEGTDIWSIQEISALDTVASHETFRRDGCSLVPPSWNRWQRKTKHEGSIEAYHSADNDNDNDNDTLREVPHPSNEGLALQARVSGS